MMIQNIQLHGKKLYTLDEKKSSYKAIHAIWSYYMEMSIDINIHINIEKKVERVYTKMFTAAIYRW